MVGFACVLLNEPEGDLKYTTTTRNGDLGGASDEKCSEAKITQGNG